MQVQESHYLWPPRPTTAIPFKDAQILYADLGWIGQLKYNDTRCLIKYCSDGTIELWNRHAEQMRSYIPPDWLKEELQQTKEILNLGEGYHLLDGGLLDQKHSAIKDTIVVWDILVQDSQYLLDTTYQHRYGIITNYCDTNKSWNSESHAWFYKNDPIGEKLTDHILIPRILEPKDWQKAWEMLTRINQPFLDTGNGPLLEGIVFKDLEGLLEMGWQEKNNSGWLARSRVTTGRHQF